MDKQSADDKAPGVTGIEVVMEGTDAASRAGRWVNWGEACRGALEISFL